MNPDVVIRLASTTTYKKMLKEEKRKKGPPFVLHRAIKVALKDPAAEQCRLRDIALIGELLILQEFSVPDVSVNVSGAFLLCNHKNDIGDSR